jgi:hypothetical protein
MAKLLTKTVSYQQVFCVFRKINRNFDKKRYFCADLIFYYYITLYGKNNCFS